MVKYIYLEILLEGTLYKNCLKSPLYYLVWHDELKN